MVVTRLLTRLVCFVQVHILDDAAAMHRAEDSVRLLCRVLSTLHHRHMATAFELKDSA